jgi:hypothetical protein
MRRREQTALWEREVFLDQSDRKPHLWGQLEGVVALALYGGLGYGPLRRTEIVPHIDWYITRGKLGRRRL